jgi:prepilin-type N-terminal cleavage/methylation domain-containing protein
MLNTVLSFRDDRALMAVFLGNARNAREFIKLSRIDSYVTFLIEPFLFENRCQLHRSCSPCLGIIQPNCSLMRTNHRLSTRRAFTLIEMLLVISIIAILAGLAIPAAMSVLERAKIATVKSMIIDVRLGITSYHHEYGRYPVAAGNRSEEPMPLDAGNPVLGALMGTGSTLNPRPIQFSQPPMAKGGVGGLTGEVGSYGLIDVWGSPIHVVMDLNYDNLIDNPDAASDSANIQSGAPRTLPMGVLVYSWGKDRQPNTADDVVSWR